MTGCENEELRSDVSGSGQEEDAQAISRDIKNHVCIGCVHRLWRRGRNYASSCAEC